MIARVGKDAEKSHPSGTAGGNIQGCGLAVFCKVKYRVYHMGPQFHSSIYAQEKGQRVHTKGCTRMFTATSFLGAP